MARLAHMVRLIAATLVLVACVYGGAPPFPPAPALRPLLAPAHGVWSLARAAEHPASTDATIEGLKGDVQIVYDDRSVPHIFASNDEDAYRALGWVVARDRLFQMYVQTMAASGRLTELAGKRALPLDREMRGLGLPRSAERAFKDAGDTAAFARFANAYADGVNAYIAQ